VLAPDVVRTETGHPFVADGRLFRDPNIGFVPEMQARDQQSGHSLAFPKLKVQAYRAAQFLDRHPGNGGLVLDLGCGPGPTTALLLRAGYQAIAVDFSLESLKVNMRECGEGPAIFVHADLNKISFREESVDGLMMSDFLQHLGDHEVQRRFLTKAILALRPGGWFCLSFFNLNIKHRLRGDVAGSFADGAIPYRRLTPRIVRGLLPPQARVSAVLPMNISYNVAIDRIVSRLPLARHLARMILMRGYRR
jgi:SAM-dependent methyltransferase